MGNAAGKDPGVEGQVSNSLDISCKLSPAQYVKHTSGECLEGCLLEIPWEIYYNTVSMYEHINASYNFIADIPEELSLHVPHLCTLNLSHNRLVTLPVNFHMLIHLRVLDLSFNVLRSFPEALAGLRSLQSLNLANNMLAEIPNAVAKMTSLEKLNLSHNQLRALPGALVECPRLSVLVCLGNNLIHPPQAICDLGSQDALTFLRERHAPSATPKPSVKMNVFVRVRGAGVVASVNNPESASVEYRQHQGTARPNKRKCPLMPPATATSLTPDALRDMLLGLVMGAAIGDAVGLNTEGLARDECLFHYSADDLSLQHRLYDHLRLHYPPHDWSSASDIMFLTLESLMRWGGVVDELEVASLVDQWRVHGHPDLDQMPGHPLSQYMAQVIHTEGYSAHPHTAAQQVFGRVMDEVARGVHRANPTDNACLPASLVLGIPNFYKSHEVRMNAERICRASHVAGVARAACVFLSLLTASLLQGKLTQDQASVTSLVNEVKEEVLSQVTNEADKVKFETVLDSSCPDPRSEDDDVTTSLSLLCHALQDPMQDFKGAVVGVAMRGGRGSCVNACVVGGVLGAVQGYSRLPQDWLGELPELNLRLLNNKLNLLLDLFGLP